MARGLTKKQKGFVKDYVRTNKNGVQSALKNYNTNDYSTAGMIASDNLKKPKIQEAIKSIADQIPDSLLVEKHLELLTVPKITKTTFKDEVTETEESIDVQAISKGLDMAYKIKGTYAPEKIKHSVSFGDVEKLSNDELKRLINESQSGTGEESASE